MFTPSTAPIAEMPLILQLLGMFAVGFVKELGKILPALLGLTGGLLGGNDEQLPIELEPTYPELQAAFGHFLTNYIDLTNGSFYGHQAFPGMNAPWPGGSQEGPGVMDIGQMSPDINSTILPNVYNSWQPWDAGTQYISDFLYNKNPLGQEDPRVRQVMDYGGFGGPGHTGMSMALEYGAPSQAGQYLGNLAQFGVTGTPMGDFMKDAMAGGLNPHRKVPVPPRR